MRLELKMMQLYEPLFLGGVNFGNKLTPKHPKGHMDLLYDTELDVGLVVYKGEVHFVKSNFAGGTVLRPIDLGFTDKITQEPTSGVAISVLPDNFPKTPYVRAQVSGPEKPVKTFTAQVSDPTRDMVRRRPGPKPKFQGEENQGE